MFEQSYSGCCVVSDWAARVGAPRQLEGCCSGSGETGMTRTRGPVVEMLRMSGSDRARPTGFPGGLD